MYTFTNSPSSYILKAISLNDSVTGKKAMTKAIETIQGAMTATQIREQLLSQAAESDEFRARLLTDPRGTLREDYGIVLPENLNFYVHEESATTAHLVLPRSKKLTDAELEAASGAYY